MPSKRICNINRKERLNRVYLSIIFFVITAYFFYTVYVNKFPSVYRLATIVPLFLAFLTLFESVFGFCVLKDKKSPKSVKIYLMAAACALVVSGASVFI